MATEAARLKRKEPTGEKKKNRLDTHRPSHGRTWRRLLAGLVGAEVYSPRQSLKVDGDG